MAQSWEEFTYCDPLSELSQGVGGGKESFVGHEEYIEESWLFDRGSYKRFGLLCASE